MIICFIFITKQPVLCEYFKDNLHTDKLAGVKELRGGSVNFLGGGWQILTENIIAALQGKRKSNTR